MKLKSSYLAIIIMVILFGGIAISSAVGWWQTTNTKVLAVYKSGEFEGLPDPADIRGSYTFGELSDAFGIPADVLGKAFGMQDPQSADLFKCKDLEPMYAGAEAEVGTTSVQLFVALYNGLPYTSEPGIGMPESAVVLLESKGVLSAEQRSAMIVVPVQATSEIVDVAAPSSGSESGFKLKGTTTFRELLDLGVSKADIEIVLKSGMPNPVTGIKDHAASVGVEFNEWKIALQALADAAAAAK